MIRKYPAGDQELDTRTAAKRDGPPKLGSFGAIVYVYKLQLESVRQTNPKGDSNGWLYHPVDTPEEASYWLAFYKSQTVVTRQTPNPRYEDAWFVPRTSP